MVAKGFADTGGKYRRQAEAIRRLVVGEVGTPRRRRAVRTKARAR
jgi:hypothetical protein